MTLWCSCAFTHIACMYVHLYEYMRPYSINTHLFTSCLINFAVFLFPSVQLFVACYLTIRFAVARTKTKKRTHWYENKHLQYLCMKKKEREKNVAKEILVLFIEMFCFIYCFNIVFQFNDWLRKLLRTLRQHPCWPIYWWQRGHCRLQK